MSSFSDVQLSPSVAKGVLRGDRAALADAYRVLSRAVMNLAARILQDRQLAEEVVQDTFIDLVEKSAQIQSVDTITAWVRKVAVNHCLMRLRSPWHARRSDVDAEEIFDVMHQDQSMEWVTRVPSMEQALASLGDEARSVVWLHDVEGYTHKEIGELMGKTASFSKSQLARAYEKLLDWRTRRDNYDAQQVDGGKPNTTGRDTGPDKRTEGQHERATLGNSRSPCAG